LTQDKDKAVIKKNIKKRGRTYEQNIGVKYLNDVAKNYRKGINSLDSVNVLNIIIDKYHKGLSKELINSIKKSIQ
jgi:deoxyadenosine/deoxycytidine kinase